MREGEEREREGWKTKWSGEGEIGGEAGKEGEREGGEGGEVKTVRRKCGVRRSVE